MSYTKHIIFIFALLSGCAQYPQQRPPDYKPDISGADVVNFSKAIDALGNNDIDHAEAMLKDLISDNPEISGPWVNLGLIYFSKNQFSESELAINNALRLNPHNPYALNLSGMLARRNSDIKRAHALYLEAIKYKDDYAMAHYNLALLYDIFFQDISAAAIHYRKYLDLIGGKDKQTVDWLEQLKNSMRKS